MTESEAKMKWCPMARLVGSVATFNRCTDGSMHRATTCLGSGCTCWVWDKESDIGIVRGVPEHRMQEEIEKQKKDKLTFLYEVPDGHRKIMDVSDMATYSLYFKKEPEKRQGHCGLCK